MSLRISSAALLLLMAAAACREPSADTPVPMGSPSAEAPREAKIDCAVAGAALAPVCNIDRTAAVLTVRHPDGGFRRLRVTPDGAIEAADGAEPATIAIAGDTIEVSIGGDRYRLPTSVRDAR